MLHALIAHSNLATCMPLLFCSWIYQLPFCADELQVSSEALKKTCPIPFDEGRLWKGANAAELRQDLQKHFQNITRVMDCVGCEKCKLWGKLQILGGHLGQSLA